MENTIQFFTEDQTRTLADFAYNLYKENREEQRKILKISDEFKNAVKELNGGNFDKKLQKDKTTLISGFKSYSALYKTLNEVFDKTGTENLLELLRNSNWYMGGANKDSIALPTLPSISTKELGSYYARDFALEGKSEDELLKRIEERICESKHDRVLRKQYRYKTSLWDAKDQIKAIIATMPACDESQAIDKVIEKMPYEEVNEVGPEEVNECSEPSEGQPEEVISN